MRDRCFLELTISMQPGNLVGVRAQGDLKIRNVIDLSRTQETFKSCLLF